MQIPVFARDLTGNLIIFQHTDCAHLEFIFKILRDKLKRKDGTQEGTDVANPGSPQRIFAQSKVLL